MCGHRCLSCRGYPDANADSGDTGIDAAAAMVIALVGNKRYAGDRLDPVQHCVVDAAPLHAPPRSVALVGPNHDACAQDEINQTRAML